jgi:hypothetical protein
VVFDLTDLDRVGRIFLYDLVEICTKVSPVHILFLLKQVARSFPFGRTFYTHLEYQSINGANLAHEKKSPGVRLPPFKLLATAHGPTDISCRVLGSDMRNQQLSGNLNESLSSQQQAIYAGLGGCK